MAFRGDRLYFKDWKGLNTQGDPENLDPNVWRDSNNVVLGPTQSAVVLRSPLAYTNAIGGHDYVLGAFQANYLSGKILLFDVRATSGALTDTYSAALTGGAATSRRTGQATLARWKRLLMNNSAHSINGSEFIQILSDYSVRANGITAPTSAPTLSFVSGGSGSFASGVTVSYAYHNTVTGHVSAPSPTSASSGASSNPTLRVAVTASAQTGVDKIVLFISVDGGSVRYLLVNSSGDPQKFNNTTGNIDISIATIFRDTLTGETIYNLVPPTNATFMFAWKDRIFLLFGTPTIQFSGYEAIPYGVPCESWPEFNLLQLPNADDKAKSGIATAMGALILGERDAYLISGYPSDKVTGPQATLTISEHMEPLNWGIGTRSPYSLTTTPFGEIWLDQSNRIMLWDHSGFPQEIGIAIRDQLKSLSSDQYSMAQGAWYPFGELGGTFILTTGDLDWTPGSPTFFIQLVKDPESGQLVMGCAMTTTGWSNVVIVTPDSTADAARVLFGGNDSKLYQSLDPDTQGNGWGSETRFFEFTIGSETEFAYFHSLRFDAPNTTGLTITVTDMDGTNSSTLTPEQPTGSGSAYFALIDRYAYRLRVKFSFDTTDSARREVKNFRVFYKPTGRQL